jgi:phytoene dehydrogenase-like protein
MTVPPHTRESADAVVIGSGPNGLVAAAILAEAGWEVLVLEAADEPGGGVRSAELTVPGFTHDVCSAFYPLAAASPIFAGLDLERYGLVWRHAPDVLAHVFRDGAAAIVSRDLNTTCASLAEFAEPDGAAWQAEVDLWRRIREPLIEALLRPFPPMRPAARLARELGTGGLLRLARRATLSARLLGNERFAGRGAHAIIAGNAMHTDLGPDDSASGLFGWLLGMLAQDVGFPVPEGGARALTQALAAKLESSGGRVDCGRRVTSVVVSGGAAVGVRDASGVGIRARKAVLADVSAPALYRDLVGAQHLPAALLRDLDSFIWDGSTIKVDWALTAPVPWAHEGVRRAGTVHLDQDLSELADVSNDLACGRVPRRPFLIAGQMSTADPTRSPAGTETMWAYTHIPHGQTWPAGRLSTFADGVEQVIEEHAPGFRDLVVGRAVAGPVELEQHNASLVEGAVNNGTAGISQQLFFRPTPGTGRADTPIDRLFLASSAAHPGGGVHGAPGSNAARAALLRGGALGLPYGLVQRGLRRLVDGVDGAGHPL